MVILDLCVAARPWKPTSWSSKWKVLVLPLLPESVWNSVMYCNRRQTIFPLYLLQHSSLGISRSHSVSLSGFPLRGWATFVSRRFHFTITALTVDRRSSCKSKIWRTDLWECWRPMTVPRWKSLSSSVWPFLLPMFINGDCISVCFVLYNCQQWVRLKYPNPLIKKRFPHTFGHVVYNLW